MKASTEERQRFARDLEQREKEFKESFQKVFKDQQSQQLSELELMMKEIKKKERQE